MADDENNEPKKKGFILRILIFVVAGLILIGAGLGGGYILFGTSQPDPSDEIESIIEKKMAEADAERLAEEEAALSNEKVVKETPDIETFVTTYFEFPGTFTTNLRSSRKFLQVGLGVSTQYDDEVISNVEDHQLCLLYTSPSPRDLSTSRMPSSA